MFDIIKHNIEEVQENITTAVKNRKVDNGEVKLIVVTKTQPIELLNIVKDLGLTAFGENRIQEAQQKIPKFTDEIEWHLIGHLQTNKAKVAVKNFQMIHSVDSKRVSQALNAEAEKIGKVQNILLQVNVADEESKFGIAVEEVCEIIEYINELPNICLCGLMNIAPYEEDSEKVRPVFREMYRLFCECKKITLNEESFKWLSMGMTNDYQVAVEEGANMLRIGSGIFGERL